MPDPIGAMLGYADRKFEKACRFHQRCTLRNDLIAAVNARRELRLHVDHQEKRPLGSQAHVSA